MFNIIEDILHHKTGDCMSNVDEENNVSQYMINRWLSMYSPNMAIIINNTTNWLYPVFETSSEYYKFLLKIVPQSKKKYIKYIKKTKSDSPSEEDQNICHIAKELELSQREIREYENNINTYQ